MLRHVGSPGCPTFQSANALNRVTQSRRDDLIAMVYSLIYLVNGVSFWASEHLRNFSDLQREEITKIKNHASPEEFCKGDARCFLPILTKIYALEYEEEPNYKEITNLLIH